MKIILRFDASVDIGLGHLHRMLSLGEALDKSLGDEGSIIYAVNSDDYAKRILRKEKVQFIEQGVDTKENFVDRVIAYENPDVVVFDQKYDYKKEDIIRWKGKTKLISIDYIGEDYQLMDTNILPIAHFDESKYPEFNNIFGGLKYTILNKNILRFKPKRDFQKEVKNIVVTTGGTDPEGVLLKLIPWLNEMDLAANILVLVGQAFKFKDELEHLTSNLPDNFRVMPYSPQELVKGDIAICAYGVSIYELIYLQIPTICISHSVENAYGARILKERYKVIEDLGYIKDINPQDLYLAITKLLTDKRYYIDMVERCGNLVDGEGAKRVAQIIVGGE